jgi:hypothetical protein
MAGKGLFPAVDIQLASIPAGLSGRHKSLNRRPHSSSFYRCRRKTAGGKYYADRQWENVFAGQNPLFQSSGSFTNLEQRDAYFTTAYATRPGMVVDLVEKGAKYPSTWRDADGKFPEGGTNYSLHLPPDIPAANFWSVTVYDSIGASGLQNGQPLPSLNSMDKPTQNADGSYDL